MVVAVMAPSSANARVPSTQLRNWSHDALHRPWWGHDVHHDPDFWSEHFGWDPASSRDEARKYPFALGLPMDDPGAGLVVRPRGSLGADALARVMYTGNRRRLRRRTLGHAKRLVREIANHDWALADAERATEAVKRHSTTRRGGDRDARRNSNRIGRAVHSELATVLTRMLADRDGRRLGDQELRVFQQLAARLAKPNRQTYVDGWQVCEWCDTVFSARQRNARRCAGCRRKRAPRLSPVRDGGVHWGTYGDPADGTLQYLGRCECGRSFTTRDVRQVFCAEHGTNAARQQRFRARGRKSG
jgi:hypothetical protein